MIEKLNKAAGL